MNDDELSRRMARMVDGKPVPPAVARWKHGQVEEPKVGWMRFASPALALRAAGLVSAAGLAVVLVFVSLPGKTKPPALGRGPIASVPGSYTPTASASGSTPTPAHPQATGSGSTPAPAPGVVQPSLSSHPSCTGAASTPGGSDPWGRCWPGPGNSGVPAGTNLVDVDSGIYPPNSRLPSDNQGWTFNPANGYIGVYQANAVIDGISESNTYSIYIAAVGSLTLKNSKVGYINDEGTSLLIENSTLDGGNQTTFATIQDAGKTVTILSSNIYGGGRGLLCGGNCTVKDSYIHDTFNSSSAQQEGIAVLGSSNNNFSHNSVGCVGACWGDIVITPSSGPMSSETVTNNLLLQSSYVNDCAYPGPNRNPSAYPVSGVTWQDNVFQKGPNGQCGVHGPVYGWYPQVCSPSACTWTGNVWDDGTPLNEP